MSMQIRADLAPSLAMQRARDLLAPVLPKHENVVEAERILFAAQRQHDVMAESQRRNRLDPFGRARLLLEEGYGLGRDAAVQAAMTNPEASAIHMAAIAVIARLINDGSR